MMCNSSEPQLNGLKMKSLNHHILKLAALFALPVFIFSACTLGDVSSDLENNELTAEEMEEASQIIGMAISEDNDGVFSSLNDALANISDDSFTGQNMMFKNDGHGRDYSGRGGEHNYQHQYDPETGIHTIQFERQVQTKEFRKNMSAQMTYLFTDTTGEFIEFPRQDRDRIHNIEYTSDKSGTVQNRHRNGEFSRADTFSIAGVSDASNILAFDGVHYGNGTYNGVRGNGNTFRRTYTNRINLLNVQIDKGLVAQNGTLEQGVTGTLSYEMNMYKSRNGEGEDKTVTGTIVMTGDGTALLKFENITKMFRIHLQSGFVSDDEAELERAVIAVDLQNNIVTLDNEMQVIITDRTEVEFDDGLESLEDVQQAINAGFNVYAEVEGYRNPENRQEFIADEIEFETDAPSADDDGEDDDSDDDSDDDTTDDD